MIDSRGFHGIRRARNNDFKPVLSLFLCWSVVRGLKPTFPSNKGSGQTGRWGGPVASPSSLVESPTCTTRRAAGLNTPRRGPQLSELKS